MAKINHSKAKRKARAAKAREQQAPSTLGAGPIGAMIRWTKLFKRLQFVLLLPDQDAAGSTKNVSRSLELQVRRRQVGLSRADFEALSKISGFDKANFQEAGLPTYAIRSIATLLGGGRIDRRALQAALAALVHGVPLVVTSHEELQRLQHLMTLTLHIPKLENNFEELRRNGIYRLQESYSQGDKSLLTLTDIDRNIARPSTLKKSLRRQVEMRRVWCERGMERWHKQIEQNLEGKTPNIGIIDLLPLIVMRLDTGDLKAITDALITPLGVMSLGLLPVMVLPNLSPGKGPATNPASVWDKARKDS